MKTDVVGGIGLRPLAAIVVIHYNLCMHLKTKFYITLTLIINTSK